jgi:hypothetical protein
VSQPNQNISFLFLRLWQQLKVMAFDIHRTRRTRKLFIAQPIDIAIGIDYFVG